MRDLVAKIVSQNVHGDASSVDVSPGDGIAQFTITTLINLKSQVQKVVTVPFGVSTHSR